MTIWQFLKLFCLLEFDYKSMFIKASDRCEIFYDQVLVITFKLKSLLSFSMLFKLWSSKASTFVLSFQAFTPISNFIWMLFKSFKIFLSFQKFSSFSISSDLKFSSHDLTNSLRKIQHQNENFSSQVFPLSFYLRIFPSSRRGFHSFRSSHFDPV